MDSEIKAPASSTPSSSIEQTNKENDKQASRKRKFSEISEKSLLLDTADTKTSLQHQGIDMTKQGFTQSDTDSSDQKDDVRKPLSSLKNHQFSTDSGDTEITDRGRGRNEDELDDVDGDQLARLLPRKDNLHTGQKKDICKQTQTISCLDPLCKKPVKSVQNSPGEIHLEQPVDLTQKMSPQQVNTQGHRECDTQGLQKSVNVSQNSGDERVPRRVPGDKDVAQSPDSPQMKNDVPKPTSLLLSLLTEDTALGTNVRKQHSEVDTAVNTAHTRQQDTAQRGQLEREKAEDTAIDAGPSSVSSSDEVPLRDTVKIVGTVAGNDVIEQSASEDTKCRQDLGRNLSVDPPTTQHSTDGREQRAARYENEEQLRCSLREFNQILTEIAAKHNAQRPAPYTQIKQSATGYKQDTNGQGTTTLGLNQNDTEDISGTDKDRDLKVKPMSPPECQPATHELNPSVFVKPEVRSVTTILKQVNPKNRGQVNEMHTSYRQLVSLLPKSPAHMAFFQEKLRCDNMSLEELHKLSRFRLLLNYINITMRHFLLQHLKISLSKLVGDAGWNENGDDGGNKDFDNDQGTHHIYDHGHERPEPAHPWRGTRQQEYTTANLDQQGAIEKEPQEMPGSATDPLDWLAKEWSESGPVNGQEKGSAGSPGSDQGDSDVNLKVCLTLAELFVATRCADMLLTFLVAELISLTGQVPHLDFRNKQEARQDQGLSVSEDCVHSLLSFLHACVEVSDLVKRRILENARLLDTFHLVIIVWTDNHYQNQLTEFEQTVLETSLGILFMLTSLESGLSALRAQNLTRHLMQLWKSPMAKERISLRELSIALTSQLMTLEEMGTVVLSDDVALFILDCAILPGSVFQLGLFTETPVNVLKKFAASSALNKETFLCLVDRNILNETGLILSDLGLGPD